MDHTSSGNHKCQSRQDKRRNVAEGEPHVDDGDGDGDNGHRSDPFRPEHGFRAVRQLRGFVHFGE
jgi:hypothetical protein